MAIVKPAISIVVDRFEHPINPDSGYSCSVAFDRVSRRSPTVRVLWNFSISCGDFETRFLPGYVKQKEKTLTITVASLAIFVTCEEKLFSQNNNISNVVKLMCAYMS